MRYDNILSNREDVLETLLVESGLSKDKLLEIDKILHEVFDYADELAFENTNLKLKYVEVKLTGKELCDLAKRTWPQLNREK
tara:strand:+ start:1097 stop:1342 length:246 start_codon:yes stop_codon:yes gene_type:complete